MAEETKTTQEENKKILRIEKIFLKDVSFETPNSPDIFTIDWQPALNFDIGHKAAKIADDDLYEAVLTLTVTSKLGDRTAYLAEVHQAGIFTIATEAPENLERLLGIFCPRTLYPYACAAMSDLVTKGGFPQLLLAPLNFDTLYNQRLNEQNKPEDA